jgi:hypothetical protein
MINKKTGELKIGTLEIGPTSTLHDICETLVGLKMQYIIENTSSSYTRLFFQNMLFEGKYYAVAIYFNTESIDSISLGVGTNIQPNDPWKDWSEADERNKAHYLKDWLEESLGSERQFNWGEAWCGYNAKSASSSIGITYKKAVGSERTKNLESEVPTRK